MRLPWGRFERIYSTFLEEKAFCVLGCLSFEERCVYIPKLTNNARFKNTGTYLLEVIDPDDCIPDYTKIAEKYREQNHIEVIKTCDQYKRDTVALLIDEDHLIDTISNFSAFSRDTDTVIFDISSLPKRFFCFMLKRFLRFDFPRNLIVTYTQPRSGGYPHPKELLAQEIKPCAHLPGFAGPTDLSEKKIIISTGFERYNINSIIEEYREHVGIRILMGFPPNGDYYKRQWKVLMDIFKEQSLWEFIEVVSSLDSELVYATLEKWNLDSESLILVPFGPKTHTLGMALFAIKHSSGIYYSQPQAYNPEYTKGIGDSWGYIAKWEGVPCFDRTVRDL